MKNILLIASQFLIVFMTYPMSYKSHLSSSWYPSKKNQLQSLIRDYKELARKEYGALLSSSSIKAIICPHAGYEYSGLVAVGAYRLIKPDFFKKVILLAPSHFVSLTGVALPGKEFVSFKNSLGEVLFDQAGISLLSKELYFVHNQSIYEIEHAVEVQIPFIQEFVGKDCKIIPLIVGKVSLSQIESIAQSLKKVVDDRTLIVVSSDFTHYGKGFLYQPFKKDVLEHIYDLDSRIVNRIEHKDLLGFDKIINQTGATICGKYPIMVLLGMLQDGFLGNVDSYVIGYDTSSKEQNPEHCVSYVSLVFSQELYEQLPFEHRFTEYEKKLLLKIARDGLQDALSDKIDAVSIKISGLKTRSIESKYGAFVTIKKTEGEISHLRGCIGTLEAKDPLYETVYKMAIDAALHDKRFEPVSLLELPEITLSVSVVGALKDISSYKDIRLGYDGVVLKYLRSLAVYLPNVAIEQGWDLEQMLSSLSQKAGLAPNAWKNDKALFRIFQSVEFSE